MIGDSVTISNLAAGNYAWRVIDDAGCYAEGMQTVVNSDNLTFRVTVSNIVNANCIGTGGGSFTINVTGTATSYEWSLNGGVTYTAMTGTSHTFTNMSAGVYDIIVKDNTGCTYRVNNISLVRQCTITLDLTVFLQGVTQPDSTMTNYIQVPPVPMIMPNLKLPTTNPYGVPGFYTQINNPSGPAGAVVDWVLVEIWGNLTPSGMFTSYDLFEKLPLLLRTDGTVVDTSGQKPEFIVYTNSEVRIIVKHRNHMSVVSSALFPFNENIVYDFTTGITQALKAPLAIYDPMIMQYGLATMWAGDLNMNEFMDNVDMSIFNIDWRARILGQYVVSDVNMDGVVNNADNSFVTRNTKLGLYSPVYFFQKR